MKTLAEIENCGKAMLIPADVAEYLGADPQSIRLQARANAAALRRDRGRSDRHRRRGHGREVHGRSINRDQPG